MLTKTVSKINVVILSEAKNLMFFLFKSKKIKEEILQPSASG
jgi:hypothetical protein